MRRALKALALSVVFAMGHSALLAGLRTAPATPVDSTGVLPFLGAIKEALFNLLHCLPC